MKENSSKQLLVSLTWVKGVVKLRLTRILSEELQGQFSANILQPLY